MPTVILHTREPDLAELMDDPDCDLAALENTYSQFSFLNRVIAGWGTIYRRWIMPRLREGPASLVDVGCGGGDVMAALAARASRDGYSLDVCGIDPDLRAIAFARRRLPGVEFLACTSTELAESGRQFDFVLSNHVLHHLGTTATARLLEDSVRLASRAVIHNDIRRDDLGWAGFSVLALPFRGSFIRTDGLRSIRRSYTAGELGGVLPEGWRVVRLAPYRLLAVFEA